MRSKLKNPQKCKQGYRNYTNENLLEAIKLVDEGMSAYKASKLTGVPQTTLKDRRLGHIRRDTFGGGHTPIFTECQEERLKEHAVEMMHMGYGYTRRELINLATDMAHYLKKIPEEKSLSEAWLYLGFLKRHSNITFLKPRSLSMARAKAITKENIDSYFSNLKVILQKYQLMDSPELIYNIDETGFSPEHSPPRIATIKGHTPQAVTSPRSTMITCIGACNALGTAIPPYLIHKGKRLSDDLREGCTPGCGFNISTSGWSNSGIFETYLQKHFLRYAQRQQGKHALILYDGSTTHINRELVEWALKEQIVLFVLPPHSSHHLQPLDVGCFKPLKNAYNSFAHRFLKEHPGLNLTRYNMTSLICQSYTVALTPTNIQNSFRKTGIWPFNPDSIQPSHFKPAEATVMKEPENSNIDVTDFLKSKVATPCSAPRRRVINKRKQLGGMAITEGEGYNTICEKDKPRNDINECTSTSQSIIIDDIAIEEIEEPVNDDIEMPLKKTCLEISHTRSGRKIVPKKPWSPSKPGPSAIYIDNHTEIDSDDDECDNSEPCCVCKQDSPPKLKTSRQLVIVNWAKCSIDTCLHWVHLKFCHKKFSVAKNEVFICPCCEQGQSEQ